MPFLDALGPAVAASGGGPVVAILSAIILALVSLVVWGVRLIFTGKLVPGADRDFWRAAFFEEQEQKRELLVTGKVVQGVVQALPDAPAAGAPPGATKT